MQGQLRAQVPLGPAEVGGAGRRVHCPITGNFQRSGRQNWVNAMGRSTRQYAWGVWALGNAAGKGFEEAKPVRDWAAEHIVGLYTSDDEFKAPDGKACRCDPRDAMSYSTAITLLKTEVTDIQVPVTDEKGKPILGADVRPQMKAGKGLGVADWTLRYLDSYAAVWYYTKMNVDNDWYDPRGLETLPDASDVWPCGRRASAGATCSGPTTARFGPTSATTRWP